MKFELFVKEEIPYKLEKVKISFFVIDKTNDYRRNFEEKVVLKRTKNVFKKNEEGLVFTNSRKALSFKDKFFNLMQEFDIEKYNVEIRCYYKEMFPKASYKENLSLKTYEEIKEFLEKASYSMLRFGALVTGSESIFIDVDMFFEDSNLIFHLNKNFFYIYEDLFWEDANMLGLPFAKFESATIALRHLSEEKDFENYEEFLNEFESIRKEIKDGFIIAKARKAGIFSVVLSFFMIYPEPSKKQEVIHDYEKSYSLEEIFRFDITNEIRNTLYDILKKNKNFPRAIFYMTIYAEFLDGEVARKKYSVDIAVRLVRDDLFWRRWTWKGFLRKRTRKGKKMR